MARVSTIKVVANNDQGFKVINAKDKTDADKLYTPSKKEAVSRAKELGIKVNPRDTAEKISKKISKEENSGLDDEL